MCEPAYMAIREEPLFHVAATARYVRVTPGPFRYINDEEAIRHGTSPLMMREYYEPIQDEQ